MTSRKETADAGHRATDSSRGGREPRTLSQFSPLAVPLSAAIPFLPPLLLNPDVVEVDAPGAGPEVLQPVTVAGVPLAEEEHGDRLLVVDDVADLSQEFDPSVLVESELRLGVQLIDLWVAVHHVV